MAEGVVVFDRVLRIEPAQRRRDVARHAPSRARIRREPQASAHPDDVRIERNDEAGRRQAAPYAEINHPTPEHFEPIMVARGAAAGEAVTPLHASWEFGSLSMNAYAFGTQPLP